ncbi:MAG: hypothetical protein IIB94_00810 [Candidatus Marinimicrobia bacterium]|nr:hypothetical protein [Candidatus Neomarinimicrobiota bacterium]
METLGLVLISFAGIFIIFIGLIVAWKILRGEIDMTKVISEEGSDKASLSRFQMLVWTFIVGLSFLYLVILNDTLPDIPNAVLSLLGIVEART